MTEKATLNAKKTGGRGRGGIIVIGAGIGILWLLTRNNKAAGAEGTVLTGDQDTDQVIDTGSGVTYPTQAPGADSSYPLGSPENPLYTEIPGELISLNDWYVERDIANVLGWTLEEFKAQIALAEAAPTGEMTAAQRYAAGYVETMAAAEYYVERNALIKADGGSWVNGVLVPPPGYAGSATTYALELAERLKNSDNEIVAAYARSKDNEAVESSSAATVQQTTTTTGNTSPYTAAEQLYYAAIAAQQAANAQAQAQANANASAYQGYSEADFWADMIAAGY